MRLLLSSMLAAASLSLASCGPATAVWVERPGSPSARTPELTQVVPAPECVAGRGSLGGRVRRGGSARGVRPTEDDIPIVRDREAFLALVGDDPDQRSRADRIDFDVDAMMLARNEQADGLFDVVEVRGGSVILVSAFPSCGGTAPTSTDEWLIVPRESAGWARMAVCYSDRDCSGPPRP